MTTPSEPVRDHLKAAIDHQQAGRLADAERLYRQILGQIPRHPDALHFLGLLAHQSGHHAAAVDLIGQALEVIPQHAPCHLHRGLALQSLGRLDEALASYQQALALDPELPEAHNNAGFVLLELGNADQALQCLERALALRPAFAEALNNRGMALEVLGRPGDALADLESALQLRPDYPEAHLNRGNTLLATGRLDEALGSYSRALELRPGHADTLNNRGQALEALGRVDDAIADYRRAHALRPGFAAAHWNEAIALLRQGDYAAGWRLYEWRRQALGPRRLVREFAEPLWLGETAIAGRTLLVHHEQGLGDTLQMLRYVPLLADQSARVIVEVPPALTALAATLPGAPLVVEEGAPLPVFDLQCPMMSLPLACATTLATVPAAVPYLAAPESTRTAWRDRLDSKQGDAQRRRIGLAWSGSVAHRNDRQRSIALATLRPLLEVDAEWHALHREYRPEDVPVLAAEPRLRDWSGNLRTLADTAGLIEHLDLVITVDTAVAHLAGALGKPVWLLLPRVADYRWLEERPDSPWYPTMRLFRQPAAGDWASVLRAVATALGEQR
ncbi:MAG: tetratricopeptide repeat-containing glycosyltransferase family protein [Gammaproteobacteria bacterium]